ncbi:MAG: homoserine dehydrogenase [Clostridiales bacterium]|jgi:homoserine dehydrogenase|nr:homoserine dehydrogenase [Clostridiales bacterium]
MFEIAVLGCGTIGSGVVEVLREGASEIEKKAGEAVRVRRVLDLRDLPGLEGALTRDFNDILTDGQIRAVVETMGGTEPAYTYAGKLLRAGKSVITSNKELVAAHGAELLALARENGVSFMFEASVGGGVPVIRPMNAALASDSVREIAAILNGTTNYILTKMAEGGADFAEALRQAQELGYAEKNPDADVNGHDTCRKLAILLSLATGRTADYKDIPTEGISGVDMKDAAYAAKIGGGVKLIARALLDGERVTAFVAPMIVLGSHPVSVAGDVFNAIFIRGAFTGELMFYGRGAGKLPTAAAVVSDVIDCARAGSAHITHVWEDKKAEIAPVSGNVCRRLVRLSGGEASVRERFADADIIRLSGENGEFAFISPEGPEKDLDLSGLPVIKTMRIL